MDVMCLLFCTVSLYNLCRVLLLNFTAFCAKWFAHSAGLGSVFCRPQTCRYMLSMPAVRQAKPSPVNTAADCQPASTEGQGMAGWTARQLFCCCCLLANSFVRPSAKHAACCCRRSYLRYGPAHPSCPGRRCCCWSCYHVPVPHSSTPASSPVSPPAVHPRSASCRSLARLPTNNNTGVFLAPLKALPAMLDRPTYAQQ